MSWADVRKIINADPIPLGPFYSGQLKGHWSLLRTMARYKFVGNLIKGKRVLDVGCGEGLGTWMLRKYCNYIEGVDVDKDAIDWAKKHYKEVRFSCNDILSYTPQLWYDTIVCVDFIEHIPKKDECKLMAYLCGNIKNNGFCVIGTPNKEMKKYESPEAKAGHINMYDHERLEKLMKKYFQNVFMFGMNDEVVYTGFKPMCQYLFAIGVNPL